MIKQEIISLPTTEWNE